MLLLGKKKLLRLSSPTFAIQIAHFKVENYWKLFPFFNIKKSIRNWYLQEVFFCEELLVVNASIVIRMK